MVGELLGRSLCQLIGQSDNPFSSVAFPWPPRRPSRTRQSRERKKQNKKMKRKEK